jgi:hypothetical protein
MLVEQVEFLERTVSERTDPEGHLELGADGQALVEASLVHLRLLDEFLGGRPSNEKDYRATEWLGAAWDHEGFLDDRRDRVDAKVAHLARRRPELQDFLPSEVSALAETCCDLFEVFVGQLPTRSASRLRRGAGVDCSLSC